MTTEKSEKHPTYECIGGPDDGDRVPVPTDGPDGPELFVVKLIDGEYRLEADPEGQRLAWRWYPAP